MLKKLLLIGLLLSPVALLAAEATLSWTPPTQNEDGSPLTDLAGYKIYYGTATGTYTLGPIDIADPAVVTHTVTGLANDTTYFFVATAYNISGVESQYSNEAIKTTAPLRPNPPLNLTVNPDNLIAYTYSISGDVLRMVPIGTVLSNTPCDTSMSMNGLYRVNRSEVDYTGTVVPPVVFAECI